MASHDHPFLPSSTVASSTAPSSDGGRSAPRAPPAAHPDVVARHIATLDRLSISGTIADHTLLQIQDKLSPFLTLAEGWRAVLSALKALAAARRKFSTLDLIDHSSGMNLLRLGKWQVGADSIQLERFCEAARPLLARLQVKSVRLIGCYTAQGDAARNVLCAIARGLHPLSIDVFGTRSLVHADHFGFYGCTLDKTTEAEPGAPVIVQAQPFDDHGDIEEPIDDDLIASQLPKAVHSPLDFHSPLDLAKAQRIGGSYEPCNDVAGGPVRCWSIAEVPAAEHNLVLELLARLDTNVAYPLRGLLRTPTVELLVPGGPARKLRSLQILFGGSLVRLFPKRSEPLIYRPLPDQLDAVRNIVRELRARSAPPGNS